MMSLGNTSYKRNSSKEDSHLNICLSFKPCLMNIIFVKHLFATMFVMSYCKDSLRYTKSEILFCFQDIDDIVITYPSMIELMQDLKGTALDIKLGHLKKKQNKTKQEDQWSCKGSPENWDMQPKLTLP